jgi:hypothetical protein
MAKLLALTLLLTWTPGFVLWVTMAGLAAAAFALAEEWASWRAASRERVLVPVRVDSGRLRR